MAKEMKQRNGCVSVWLWFAILMNLGMTIYDAVKMFETYSVAQALWWGLCSMMGLFIVMGGILLLRWVKAGFSLFVISSLVMAFVDIVLLKLAPIEAVTSIVAIFIWWAILQIRKDGKSAWSQLIKGWDVKHCRHLYQLFGVLEVMLLLLTIIACGSVSNEPEPTDDEFEPLVEEEPVEDVIVIEDSIPSIVDELPAPNPNPAPMVTPEPVTPIPKAEPTPENKKKLEEPKKSTPTPSKSAQEEALEKLESLLKEANSYFPIEAGNGTIIVRAYMSGNYVMYQVECDENIVDMNKLEENKAQSKRDILNTLKAESYGEMKKVCKIANKGIAYTYVGDTSGQKVIIYISASEL
ncbi:MAG: hypothetical protein LUD17_11100 [Bacteroidales bacterium]|nr:hypothetical protein [Bacteroidales bacterium]